jgi:hypothetical protein
MLILAERAPAYLNGSSRRVVPPFWSARGVRLRSSDVFDVGHYAGLGVIIAKGGSAIALALLVPRER